MYISSGAPESEPIDMPNVTGYSLSDAVERLVTAGFTRSKIKTTMVNDKAAKDTVLSVSPSGSKVLPDAEIELKVSTGFSDVEIQLPMPNTDTTGRSAVLCGRQDGRGSDQPVHRHCAEGYRHAALHRQ